MVALGLLGFLWLAVVVQRLAELRVAARNEEWARERGATEHGRGHYPLFFVLHTGWLLAWPTEAWLRGPELATAWPVWLVMFVAAQALRYWAIASLGRAWNTRILVVPGMARVDHGAYRLMRHPNYVAVVIELLALPILFHAWITASVVGVLNAALLLLVRIPSEERALRG